ncbi:MAG: hypothetical protein VST70_05185, partial [Nitrospirota bacterium]|nr:hypothetical protein [Nitrospirota bacterium]
MKSRAVRNAPAKVKTSLSALGTFIQIARKRRRLTLDECSVRAQTSVLTLRKIEKGDPSVAVGTVLGVL